MIRALTVAAIILLFALLYLAWSPVFAAGTVGATGDREMGEPISRKVMLCFGPTQCAPVTLRCRYIKPRLLACGFEVRIK